METSEPIKLSLDWAMKWGYWGPKNFCPKGTFANAFKIKVEDYIRGDNSAMNGIELFCRSPVDVGRGEFGITSTVQIWGNWKRKRMCSSGYLTGLRMKSEKRQGDDDDTAANDLEMQCDRSTATLYGGGERWVSWSSWESCPQGCAICGIQTKVESIQGRGDDTALNDVRMFCCLLNA